MISASRFSTIAIVATSVVVLASTAGAQQRTSTTPRRTMTVQPFSTEVVNVRTSRNTNYRMVAVTLRFTNKLQRPVTLAYVQGSPVVIDDRGNRYELRGEVRGIGAASPTSYDPKFTIVPGGSADAMFEFAWSPRQGQLFGLKYELNLAARELRPTPGAGDQFRAAGDHVVRHENLEAGTFASADAGGCGERCSAATGLTAEVTRVTGSRGSGFQFAHLTVRFKNTGNEPLILCYAARSALGTDERGNRYGIRDGGVRGMGVCANNVADASFALAPGEARDATMEYALGIYAGTVVGSVVDATAALLELRSLPGDQIQTGREVVLSFHDLALSGSVAQASGGGQHTSGGGGSPSGGSGGTSGNVPPPAPDLCAGKSNCYSAGIFTAELFSVAVTRANTFHYVKLGVRLRNASSEPLVLCFASSTAVGTDERQNRYGVADNRVQALGVCRGSRADPSFQLMPGQQRDATIEYQLGIYRGTIPGTVLSATFTLQQLNLLPGNQITRAGEYIVTFENVTESGGSRPAAQARGLLDALRKATKKP